MIKKIILLSVLISQLIISCSGNDESSKTETLSTNEETILETEFPICATIENSDKTNIAAKAVFKNDNKWITGQTIKIGFVGGTVEIQNKVKEFANEWTFAANLKFEYVNTNEVSDVKIYFEKGSNYTFGKSINFGQLLHPNITDELIKSIVLHEFGHLLGLHHENQNPNANIQWNKPAVYDYYQNTLGWTKELVDSQIFATIPTSRIDILTEYDPSSIMAYSFPASFTTNGFSVPFTSKLSSMDKLFIRKMYPFPIKPNLRANERLDKNNRITSPNGRYYLTIRSYNSFKSNLIIYDDLESKIIWNRTPNIKLSNFNSTNVFCELRGGELLLFQGNVSRKMMGDTSLKYIQYATITNTGDIELISFENPANPIAVWSLFRGQLN